MLDCSIIELVDFLRVNPVNRDLVFGRDGTKRAGVVFLGATVVTAAAAGFFGFLLDLPGDGRVIGLLFREELLSALFRPVNLRTLTVPVNPFLACCSGITVFGPLFKNLIFFFF